MAEKLVVQKAFWKGGAVYLYQPGHGPARTFMERVGYELLARAVLPRYQHREVGHGELSHLLHEILHLWTPHADLRREVAPLQQAVLLREPGHSHCARDDLVQHVEIQGFLHIVGRAELERLDGAIHGRVAGDHDHRNPGVDPLQFHEDVDATLFPDHNVEEDGDDPPV